MGATAYDGLLRMHPRISDTWLRRWISAASISQRISRWHSDGIACTPPAHALELPSPLVARVAPAAHMRTPRPGPAPETARADVALCYHGCCVCPRPPDAPGLYHSVVWGM